MSGGGESGGVSGGGVSGGMSGGGMSGGMSGGGVSGGGVSGGGMGGNGQHTPPLSSAVDFAATNACHQAHDVAVTALAVLNQEQKTTYSSCRMIHQFSSHTGPHAGTELN